MHAEEKQRARPRQTAQFVQPGELHVFPQVCEDGNRVDQIEGGRFERGWRPVLIRLKISKPVQVLPAPGNCLRVDVAADDRPRRMATLEMPDDAPASASKIENREMAGGSLACN